MYVMNFSMVIKQSVLIYLMHGWRDSNSQPMVLETIALPIELHPSDCLLSEIRQQAQAVLFLDNFGNLSGTYGTTTLADRESQTFFHRNRRNQLHGD